MQKKGGAQKGTHVYSRRAYKRQCRVFFNTSAGNTGLGRLKHLAASSVHAQNECESDMNTDLGLYLSFSRNTHKCRMCVNNELDCYI